MKKNIPNDRISELGGEHYNSSLEPTPTVKTSQNSKFRKNHIANKLKRGLEDYGKKAKVEFAIYPSGS